MTKMETPAVWKKLLIDGRRMASSEEVRSLAREIGKNEWRSVKYLQEHGYLVRILRGIFYVRSPDEIERGMYDASIFEMVSMALDMKRVKRWYYGMETALKLNYMTHEYYNIEYVITDSYRTTKDIRILDTYFRFISRDPRFFGYGILEEKNYQYSDPEKTVLDLIHTRYMKTKEIAHYLSPLLEHKEKLDMHKFQKYLKNYSLSFQAAVEAGL
ncbi:MAG: hypothetical protein QCI38_02755 [Candidatus Thermoplasmatota archaeon]|nr:hypothetical protein [Candidatus Thermoplasmatota archaeon]